MKIKSLIVASACLLSLQAENSFASMYGKIDFGMLAPLKFSDYKPKNDNSKIYKKNKADTSVVYGFGVGTSISNFRAEAVFSNINEISFKYVDPNITMPGDSQQKGAQDIEQKIYGKTIMANFFYDIGDFSGVMPYLGAGVGVAMIDPRTYDATMLNNKDLVYGKRSNSMAFAVGAGFAYKITEKFALDLGYMYNDYGKIKNKSSVEYIMPSISDAGVLNAGNVLTDSGDSLKNFEASTKLRAHTIRLGCRMMF